MTRLLLLALLALDAPAQSGLPKVPKGFECRLVAGVPAVTYPCQLAAAPDGALFVAEDPMDQIGPYEADHGRILLLREGGEPTVFADGFRAIFGLAWHDGTLYVSHMPHLTVLRDTDGDGKADERTALFKDLGPTDNRGLNDHIVSGLQFGMDGYLYISVGDKGIPKATGPDGGTIQLIGGGVVRCRPDGTDIEVVSTGTRNHLEANLDEFDNIFTYDNTDDGDGWWTRVTHHIDGGYYGYPYDYHDRPDRHLPRMAEYGGGSPCGALVYKEDAWPEKYRGMAFWAEWGKGKVHAFRFAPDGATFKVAEELDFALPGDAKDFRPIDLALSPDGRTLYVADWNMGGWGRGAEKVGRVFAISYTGDVKTRERGKDGDPIDVQIKQLDHPSFGERMRVQRALAAEGREARGAVTAALLDPNAPSLARRHLIWALDAIAGGTPEATLPLIEVLKSGSPELRAQSARALGLRRVPIAVGALIDLLKDPEPSVRLQAIIALGRIGDAQAVPTILPILADQDTFLAFGAREALRRIGDWKAVTEGLKADDAKLRLGVLAAMEEVYHPDAVAALAGVLVDRGRPADERAKALDFLAQGYRKPRPWNGRWWGTRPTQGRPPAKVFDWEGTRPVLDAVRAALDDPEAAVRRSAVAATVETKDEASLPALRARFTAEPDAGTRGRIASALGALKDREALPLLVAALRDGDVPEPVRDAALGGVEAIGGATATRALIELLSTDLSPERQPRVIATLGKAKAAEAVGPIAGRLASPSPAVRAASAEALGRIGESEGVVAKLGAMIDDPDLSARKAAIASLGSLKDQTAVPPLLAAADRAETRFEAGLALAKLPDIRALRIYLAGLGDKNPDLRAASSRALSSIRDQAAPALQRLADRDELPPSLVPELRKVFAATRPILEWRLLGPFALDAKPPIDPAGPIDLLARHPGAGDKLVGWSLVKGEGEHGAINLNRTFSTDDRGLAFALAEFDAPAARRARFTVGSDDTLTVWLNGTQVHDFQGDRGFNANEDHFDADVKPGTNRLLVRTGNHGGGWLFSAAVMTAEEHAFLKAPSSGGFDAEAFRAFALKNPGDADRGRALFVDPKGLACVKCHAVAGQGGDVGPDLTGIGARYPREELIASVLFPSAKIFSGYESAVVALADGRVVTGIVKSDTPEALELQDAEANRHRFAKDEIDDRKAADVSLMPNGLADGLQPRDFADLIAYLEALKDPPPKP